MLFTYFFNYMRYYWCFIALQFRNTSVLAHISNIKTVFNLCDQNIRPTANNSPRRDKNVFDARLGSV